VLVGGHPGEWEGEHPAELADRLGVAGVYLAGWHSHDELPQFFSAADAVVSASEREQFGLTLVEAMACGIPPVAMRSLGPETIIDPGSTGWLVENEAGLTEALVDVVNDAAERRRRGSRARVSVGERFSWSAVADDLGTVIEEVLARARTAPAVAT
jgi:glycosyltransferase involved in cell wall biosynthesis